MADEDSLNYHDFEGIPFDRYRPFDLDSENSETVVCFSDLHAYGRDSELAEYAASAVNALADFYNADKALDLGDFGSTKSLHRFHEVLQDDIEHECIPGDEDETPRGFMSNFSQPDFENLSLEEDGIETEIQNWRIKATHEPEISPYHDRGRLIMDSIEIFPDYNNETLEARVRSQDFDLHLYGHSHLAYCRPDVFSVYNSPGSMSEMKNTNSDKDFPEKTIQILNISERTLDVLTLDAQGMNVQEHRRYERGDEGVIKENKIIGEFGVERIHGDMRARALGSRDTEEMTIEEAVKERKREFREKNTIGF